MTTAIETGLRKPMWFAVMVRLALHQIDILKENIRLACGAPSVSRWGLEVLASKGAIDVLFDDTHIFQRVMSRGVNAIHGCLLAREHRGTVKVPCDEFRFGHKHFDLRVGRNRGDASQHVEPRGFGATRWRSLPFSVIGSLAWYTPCRATTTVSCSQRKIRQKLSFSASGAPFHVASIPYPSFLGTS